MSKDSYTVKDMQQIMMAEQKVQRDILETQTRQLNSIEHHLANLNGKVARHQETLYEKERGHGDRIGTLEGWHLKMIGAASVISIAATLLIQLVFKLIK